MLDTTQQKPTHHFGVFELDLRSGELRKHGVRLKLQRQPLQLLAILIECAGEVVTREEIQKRLWPDDTYLDFDNAINSSVRKLREALGDNPDSPRFIETLSRRGYRFIAPVARRLQPQESEALDQALAPSDNGFHAPGPPAAALGRATKKRRRVGLIAIAAAVLAVFCVALSFVIFYPVSRGIRPDRLLNAVPLTSDPGYEILPSYSPEGTRVTYTWLQPGRNVPDVYLKLLGPGEPVRLSKAGGFGAVWSPDGRFIAFLRPLDMLHAALIIVPAVGGQERELTRLNFVTLIADRYGVPVPAPFIVWSADGKRLLTLDQKSPGLFEPNAIVRVSVDTGDKRVLTSPRPGSLGDGGLALSPDGRTLAFTQDSGLWARDIYLAPLSEDLLFTGSADRLTFDNRAIAGLAWNRDGEHLVFSSPRNGMPELWTIAARPGTQPARLGSTENEATDIAVSRDGKRLMYSHQLEDQDIWRVPLNAGGLGAPSGLIVSTRRDTQARYSPDGQRIAFESDRSGNEEIWVCNADSSNPVQLTYFGHAWAGAPKWSPDGKKIAFAANAAGNWDIYVVDAGGGKPVRVTGDGADESWPSWSRDGNWIYFWSNRGNQGQVWKKRAGGTGLETQVTRNGGFWSDESADGKNLLYVNAQGLWKLPLNGGVEINLSTTATFAAARDGVYFATFSGADRIPISFFDFKTRRTRAIGAVPGRLGWNMNVSPDERWLIYSKMDRWGSELMQIDNFE